MRQIGKGFSGAFKLCSTLNLPRLTKTAYKNQDAKLLKVVQEVAEESMIKAATEIMEKKQNLSSDIVKCGISVDGTWQRRGYTSMNGCVAAISVDTAGKVLDIEVMPSYCPTCKRLQTMPRNFEYESLKADHICQCNFTGSSSKMEIVGASRIFFRSEKNRRLHYTQYYGDGDSKAFMSVKDTYGLNSVTKFESIGHVQKRVGLPMPLCLYTILITLSYKLSNNHKEKEVVLELLSGKYFMSQPLSHQMDAKAKRG
ncbi:uncharacterized protein TNCV_636211 [Trichonephila clavipes]|nr:uncharacterized protein TNCV_636211 [Trichonephila clavipes]